MSEMSKRERQKKRREARLQQERAAEARSQRTRIAIFVLLGLVFVGLVVAAVARNRAERAEQIALAERVQERLDELGCTPAEEQENRGQGHLDGAALAQQPPETLYPSRPATSGEHYSSWLITGVYDEVMDERALVHNLEHGYVVAYYDSDAPDEQVEELKSFAREQIDGNYPKIIVSPWDGDLPESHNFAFTAWNVRQMCEELDTETLSVFLADHHSGAGDAPEKTLPPHMDDSAGVDPGDEPFLLPPLGDDAPADAPEQSPEEEATDGADGADEATEATS